MLWLSFWEYEEGKPFQIKGVWVGILFSEAMKHAGAESADCVATRRRDD
jgi:hypothetical protein